MRKLWLLVPFILLLLIAPVVSAEQNDSKKIETTTVKSSDTVNRNYFAANERVEIDGIVNGDTFLAGGSVDVSGKINGDLLVVGGEVNISGEVTDDVRVAGGQVRISGKIGKNLTVAGGNVEVSESANIGQSVVATGGNVTLAAPISGTVNGGMGNLTIDNRIGGDVEVGVGLLKLNSNAVINGDLIYWSDNDATISDSAEITGETTKKSPPLNRPEIDETKILGVIAGFALAIKIFNLITWFVIGLLLIHFFPQFSANSIKNLKDKPWASLGFGFLALLAIPILAIALMVIVIGIPLGIILLALYGIVIYFARIPVIYLMGQWLLSKFTTKEHRVWSLVIGLLVYGILTVIPIIGALVSFFAMVFGLGAWLMAEEQVYKEARKKNLI